MTSIIEFKSRETKLEVLPIEVRLHIAMTKWLCSKLTLSSYVDYIATVC